MWETSVHLSQRGRKLLLAFYWLGNWHWWKLQYSCKAAKWTLFSAKYIPTQSQMSPQTVIPNNLSNHWHHLSDGKDTAQQNWSSTVLLYLNSGSWSLSIQQGNFFEWFEMTSKTKLELKSYTQNLLCFSSGSCTLSIQCGVFESQMDKKPSMCLYNV